MGDTKIGWTDKSWNPIRGCSRVSEGCRHCYAEQVAARFNAPGQPYHGLATVKNGHAAWTGEVRFIEEHLTDPLKWRKPRRVFVNSMSDLFHEKVSHEWLDRIFAVMALAPQHRFQVLTKRPDRMRAYLSGPGTNDRLGNCLAGLYDAHGGVHPSWGWGFGYPMPPLPNVHLGVSVENQATADERIQLLLQTPAAVRWISAEPLLGPIDLTGYEDGSWWTEDGQETDKRLDWVVVGGESGKGHRTMELAWLEQIVQQCRAAFVPVFVKQDSGPKPGQQGRIPDELWVQEFPTGSKGV